MNKVLLWNHVRKNQVKREESKQIVSKTPKETGSGARSTLLAQIWGHQKVTRLNKLIDPDYCGKMTVRDLASIVLADTTNFPQGLDTPLCIGDFEGNFCTNVLSVTTGGEESDHICVMGDPNGDME